MVVNRVMVVNSVMSMMGIGVVVDDVVIHVEVSMVGDGSIMMVIVVDIMGHWFVPVCEWVVISMMYFSLFNVVMLDAVAGLGSNVVEEFIVLMLHVSHKLLTMVELNITWIVVTIVMVWAMVWDVVMDGKWCGADRSGEDSNNVKGSHILLRLIIIS